MIYLVIVMNFFLAILFSLSKIVVAQYDPLLFLAARMLFSATIFWFCYKLFEEKVSLTIHYALLLLFLGFFNVYLTTAGQLWALQTLSGAQACLIYNCNPFIIVLLSYFFLQEKITKKKMIGLLLGWTGLFIALVADSHSSLSFIGRGQLAVFGAAVATSFSAIMLQRMMRQPIYPLFFTLSVSMALGGILALLQVIFSSCTLPPLPSNSLFFISGAMVIFATLMCAGLYAYLLKYYSAGFLAFTGFIAPLCAALIDWFVIGTTISWHFYVALVLIGIGLFFFYQDEVI